MKIAVVFTICCIFLFILSAPIQAKTEEEYQQEILSLRRHNTQLENQLEQVSTDLKRSTEEVKILQRQLAKMAQEGEQYAKELQETRDSMKQVRSQLEALLEQQTDSSKAVQKQQKIEEQLTQSRQHAEKLEKDLKKLTQEKHELETKLAATSQRPSSEAATQELQAQQSELAQIRDQFKANLVLLHEREQALEQASQEIEALQQEVSLLQILVKQHKDQAQQGEALPGQQSLEQQRISELEAALTDMNTRLVRLTEEKADLETQLGQAGQSELQAANQKVTDLQSEVETLRNWIKQQKEQSEQGKPRVDPDKEAEKRINELETTLAEVNAALLRTVDEKTKLEAQLSAQQPPQDSELAQTQEIQRLEGELRKAADYINALNQETAQLKQQQEDLQSEIQMQMKAAEQQKQQLEEQLANAKAQLQEQGSVPEAAKQRIEELTLELQETKTLLDQQQRYQKEYPLLQQELITLRAQLDTLSQEKEQAERRSQKNREIQMAYDQAQKELDAVASTNLDLKAALQNQEEQKRAQEEKFQEILTRNQSLEQQYQEGRHELDLKERLLQQALTEKAMLEKFIDEKGSPFEELNQKLQQIQAENTELRKQIQELNAMQIRVAEAPQASATSLAALQQQLLTERTLRQQLETRLQQVGQSGSAAATQASAIFPPEVAQRTTGGALTMLGRSPDGSKLAYQESINTIERLWIYNQRTGAFQKITEWQRKSSGETQRTWLSWAYDNEHFLLATGIPGQYALYAGNSSQLFSPPIQLSEQSIHFAWSPTQLQFAYFSESNLIVSAVHGTTLPVQIGHQPGVLGTALAWSPDGTSIAFSCKRGANFDIYTLLFSRDTPLLQTLVASSSDDIHPSWSPDGHHIAFYVRSSQYDTKLAVTPMDKSRSPYIAAHNVSLPSEGGPVWATNTSLLYVGEEYPSASQNFIYSVDIATGQRSAAPLSLLLSR
ncbi:MAG: hypothetical protein RBT80_01265 [Candidatus Vecturithrix sp.]|jgi:chromosome segregation ATPase|nr:hypothetical protein [Candidatus Vecturithrix sp.]